MTPEELKKAFDNFCMQEESYKPPITVYQTIEQVSRNCMKRQEAEIMFQVNQYVDVDKDELIKALMYDREQYEKGYRDGYNAGDMMYKRAFENACKAYADAVRGADIDLFRRDMLEDARKQV